jgi:hypothetical protein
MNTSLCVQFKQNSTLAGSKNIPRKSRLKRRFWLQSALSLWCHSLFSINRTQLPYFHFYWSVSFWQKAHFIVGFRALRNQVGIMIVVYLFDGEKVLESCGHWFCFGHFSHRRCHRRHARECILLKFYPRLLAAAGARMGVGFLAAPKASGTCSHRRRQSRRSKLNSHVNTNNCSWATASRHLDFEWAAVAPSRAHYARAKMQTDLQLNEKIPPQILFAKVSFVDIDKSQSYVKFKLRGLIKLLNKKEKVIVI